MPSSPHWRKVSVSHSTVSVSEMMKQAFNWSESVDSFPSLSGTLCGIWFQMHPYWDLLFLRVSCSWPSFCHRSSHSQPPLLAPLTLLVFTCWGSGAIPSLTEANTSHSGNSISIKTIPCISTPRTQKRPQTTFPILILFQSLQPHF